VDGGKIEITTPSDGQPVEIHLKEGEHTLSVQAEFEERTWQAFWRATIDEEPTADIAADLGMSAGAVRKAKFRVLRRLRSEFENLID
jgi:DNA-directed RNA polymerase specialized sigma24 family protein